ncbi:hypothetical protein [Jiangella alba]|uniref:Uncharacterized protein n=1 Tax=Jiangella alba TaxID=561176 RepID=A0A1H5P4D6_9ACTN|nr:hypothetical protein [Jiangella alba]SEF08464.1 hypothetical protein SAMN04488561_3646 [Jiangella alba]
MRGRTKRATRRGARRWAALAVAALVGAALIPGAAAAGEPAPADLGTAATPYWPGDRERCGAGDARDGIWFLDGPVGGGGHAVFDGGDETLEVVDTKSNGYRVVALFSWCEGPLNSVGTYRSWLHRDSGPNEGATDREVYDFDFAEGRRLLVRVCEKNMSTGRLIDCSWPVRMYA